MQKNNKLQGQSATFPKVKFQQLFTGDPQQVPRATCPHPWVGRGDWQAHYKTAHVTDKYFKAQINKGCPVFSLRMTFHSRMLTAACPGISGRHPSPPPPPYRSMRYPKTGHQTLLLMFPSPQKHTHTHSCSLSQIPWADWPLQEKAGESTAPPFLGTKKQLIYVSETRCLGRPSLCVCGSPPVKLREPDSIVTQ